MAIVQDAYDLTDDILTKILTGEYRRVGSVIRYATGPNKGRIVKHLEPVHMEVSQQAQSLGTKAIQFAKNNKKALSIQLSTEELGILVNRIFEYTEKLAKDNSVDLTEDELDAQISDGTILNLQRYLKAQKRIFEITA